MNETPASIADQAETDARRVYQQHLAAIEAERPPSARRDRLFGIGKLIAAAVAVVVALWVASMHPSLLAWALTPAALFVALWIAHERLLRAQRNSARVEEFYRRGIARLEDRWAGHGDGGLAFLDPEHRYARDLDLFGSGSLYERLSLAASAPGRQTLAGWLLAPAALAEIALRQEAVRELTPRLDLRERLALAADAIQEGTPETLIAWAESQERSVPAWLLYAAPPLALAWLAAIFVWLAGGSYTWLVVFSVVNAALIARSSARIRQAAAEALRIAPLLGPLHRVLAVYQGERFHAPRLVGITTAVERQGISPSHAIAKLERLLAWLESSDNWFVKLTNRFVFWTPLSMLAIERWRARHGSHMRAWLGSIGHFEALCSLAGFAYECPGCTFPTLCETAPTLDAAGLTHPLLPAATAVSNDLRLDRSRALIIVSGPNMAGKSTLLRAIGLNAVLAQCGAPVCCARLTLSPLAVGASIHVEDSLQGGLSRFYAEIRRLKRVADLAQQQPALFLLDELLSGTNSHDRRVGTEALLRTLLARNAIGLITTHDLALTEIAATLGNGSTNMHFGDSFRNGELRFDYRLTPGIADSTNALELMRSIGLEV